MLPLLPPQLNLKQEVSMGELLDKLGAVEAFEEGQVQDAHRPLADGVVQHLSAMADTAQATVSRLSAPGMPLDIIGKWTRKAPLQALGVAFLIGVILARPRR